MQITIYESAVWLFGLVPYFTGDDQSNNLKQISFPFTKSSLDAKVWLKLAQLFWKGWFLKVSLFHEYLLLEIARLWSIKWMNFISKDVL